MAPGSLSLSPYSQVLSPRSCLHKLGRGHGALAGNGHAHDTITSTKDRRGHKPGRLHYLAPSISIYGRVRLVGSSGADRRARNRSVYRGGSSLVSPCACMGFVVAFQFRFRLRLTQSVRSKCELCKAESVQPWIKPNRASRLSLALAEARAKAKAKVGSDQRRKVGQVGPGPC